MNFLEQPLDIEWDLPYYLYSVIERLEHHYGNLQNREAKTEFRQ